MNTIFKALKPVSAIIISAIIISGCGSNKEPNSSIDTTEAATEANTNIPGLKPVDVYLNLEKQGFTTAKNFSSENGASWDCKSSDAGIDYTVYASGKDANSVERIKATAMLNGQENKEIAATMPFLKYIGTLPFEGNEPAKIAEWVTNNFNNDKQSITVANVTFTLYAPTENARVLDIQKAK